MKVPACFLLLAALLLLFSGAPSAKYTENLTIQVFDMSLRPVEGAQVYVEHEINSVQGSSKTKPVLSDSRGYANIIFTDYEEIDSETEYAYTLFVKYGSQLVSASLIAVDGENRTYTMMVDSQVAYVRVVDQKGRPLYANVTVGTATKQTDSSGSTAFILPPGNYTLRVEQGDLIKNIPFEIDSSTGDRSLEAVLSHYSLDVLVQDDMRRPLSAQVEVNGAGRQTGSDGHALFENITVDSPQVVVVYGQGIKRLQPDLKSTQGIEVTFDIDQPVIKDQYSTISPSGVGTIRFFVEDNGPQASGIDTVAVSYEIGGVPSALSVYAIGFNSFEAKIPAQPEGTLVKYAITVSDKDGNTAVENGNYVVSHKGNSTVPGTGGALPSFSASSIPNEGIFVGIVVVALLAYAAIYYYNKRKGGEISPPPVAPPQVPQQ